MKEQSERLRKKMLESLDLGRDYRDEEIREMIQDLVDAEARVGPMSIRERLRLEEAVFNSLRRLDVLQELIDDPEVTEILVNGPNHIFYEKEGRLHSFAGSFRSEDALADMIQNIVGQHNRMVNQASPIVDTRLPDGSRVNIVLSPIAIDGSAISIRKFPREPLQMARLIEIGSISREAAGFLEILVKSRYNILISGGTGSGKTTFLNALSQYIPKEERLITIEDSAELQLQEAENLVRLETRNANLEGVRAISIRDLIRTALRMRPDRIIVGECRGEEALDMLTAMNTGHEGSLSTLHANSCEDALARLETMVIMGKELPLSAVRSQIASGVDIIVQLGRLRDKSRRVLEIAEIDGIEDGEIRLHAIYRFKEAEEMELLPAEEKDMDMAMASCLTAPVEGALQKSGALGDRRKLQQAGYGRVVGNGL